MYAFLRLGIVCLIGAATAQATVIGGTSATQPLPYNGFNTYAYIFGGSPNFQLAVPFTPAAGFDYILSSGSVPLRSFGPTAVQVDIYDTFGINPGTKLAGFSAPTVADFTYHLISGTFSGSPILHGGQQYFFHVSAPTGSGQVDWAGASPNQPATIYYQGGTTSWNHTQSFSSPAFQVVALSASTPEPGTILLLGAGVVFLLARRTLKA